MKAMNRVLALLMAMAMLLTMGGYAEEQGGSELELLPTENTDVPTDVPADAPADVPVDEPLPAEGEVAPESATLTLDPVTAVLDYSQSVVLTAFASAGAESVTWISSDENVASLSATSGESVTVVGVNAGTATITCASGELVQICEVTVNAPGTLQITGVDYPATFQLGHGGWNLRNGTVASTVDLATLTTVIKNASGEAVREAYTHIFDGGIRRFDICEIDSQIPFSKITDEGAYTWTLSATDVSGRSVSMSLPINVSVSEETAVASNPGVYSPVLLATGIALDSAELVMQPGEVRVLMAAVTPSEAVNSAVMWASDDPSVATVTQNGEVTAVGVGSATITCTALGGADISASCAVTVPGETAPAEGEIVPEAMPEQIAAEGTQPTGRNLILNSGFAGMTDAGIYRFNGDEVTFSSADFNAEEHSFALPLSEYGIQNLCGKTVLLSMEYRIDETLEFGTTNPWVGFQVTVVRDEATGGGNQGLDWYGGTLIPTNVTQDWVRYDCLARVSDYNATSDTSVRFYLRDTKGTISFRHPVIEILDTEWSPAPEDMN